MISQEPNARVRVLELPRERPGEEAGLEPTERSPLLLLLGLRGVVTGHTMYARFVKSDDGSGRSKGIPAR
jgi:hypothetical protein